MIQTAEVTYLHVEAIWRARFATFAFLGVFARYRGQSSAGASASWLIASLARLPRRSQPFWPSSDHMASYKETQSGCGARKGHGHDRGHARRSARRHGLPRGRWAIDSPWHRRPSDGTSWRAVSVIKTFKEMQDLPIHELLAQRDAKSCKGTQTYRSPSTTTPAGKRSCARTLEQRPPHELG